MHKPNVALGRNFDGYLAVRDLLIGAGWFSPDTYCDHFEPLPDGPGVYIFVAADLGSMVARVAYVGQSKRLRRRLVVHEIRTLIEQEDFWAQRWFRPVPLDALRTTERQYIEHFDPPYNLIGRRRGLR